MDVPSDIVRSMLEGEVSQEQLRRLVIIEAEEIGLTLETAVEKWKTRSLPNSCIGSDLDFLIEMLNPVP